MLPVSTVNSPGTSAVADCLVPLNLRFETHLEHKTDDGFWHMGELGVDVGHDSDLPTAHSTPHTNMQQQV